MNAILIIDILKNSISRIHLRIYRDLKTLVEFFTIKFQDIKHIILNP